MERAADTRGATPRAPTTVAESVAGRAPTVKRSKPKATPRATPPARMETAARALGTPARMAEAARIMVGARKPPVTLVAMERAADTRGATPRAPTTVAESVAGRAPTVNLSKPN